MTERGNVAATEAGQDGLMGIGGRRLQRRLADTIPDVRMFATRLRVAIATIGVHCTDVAAIVGMTNSGFSRLCRGYVGAVNIPVIHALAIWARGNGIDPLWLFTGIGNPPGVTL